MTSKNWIDGDGPFKTIVIDGHLIARWMAKTACDLAAADNFYVPRPFIKYAYSTRDDSEIYVYSAFAPGDKIPNGAVRFGAYWLHSSDDVDEVLVCFDFYGLLFVLGSTPISGAEAQVRETFGLSAHLTGSILNRVRKFDVDLNVPNLGLVRRGSVKFNWTG